LGGGPTLIREQLDNPTLANEVVEGFDVEKFFGFKITQLKKQKGAALLGYMKMNIVDPPEGAFWGKFNNRLVDEAWVETLHKRFIRNMDNSTDEHAIDVVVDPEWLENPDGFIVSVDGDPSNDGVQEMKFNPAGALAIRNKNLWVLSGHHRRLALIRYVHTLKTELDEAMKAIEDITKGKSNKELSSMGEKAKERLEENERLVKLIEPRIHQSKFWAVRAYNRGASRGRSRDGPETRRLTRRPFSQDRHGFQGFVDGAVPIHLPEHHGDVPRRDRRGDASGDHRRNERRARRRSGDKDGDAEG
jgi:hypothetical protein